MKVIKNINNNVSLCLDSNGNEVIAFGKGIGFIKPPYEIDLNQVEKTYYNLNQTYINMIQDISLESFDIADKIVNYAVIKLNCDLNSNLIFTIADHINFAIKRFKQNINLRLPIVSDIEHLFEDEIDIGKYALQLIQKQLNIDLPKEEAAYIALNIINSEFTNNKKSSEINEQIIQDITKIIEKHFGIDINQNDFSYSRFRSHVYYLLKREEKNETIRSDNKQLFDSLIDTYPKTYKCVYLVKEYLLENYNWTLIDEECLYLILHINRLCAREDCYQ